MDLHGQIMNLQPPPVVGIGGNASPLYAYKVGHRDARHAAAELALKADALADEVRALLALAENDSSTEWNVALCRLRDALAAADGLVLVSG